LTRTLQVELARTIGMRCVCGVLGWNLREDELTRSGCSVLAITNCMYTSAVGSPRLHNVYTKFWLSPTDMT